MKVTMERLGVIASFSRPRVSNDNAFSEALFPTCKSTPRRPRRGFATIEEARARMQNIVRWHNLEHRRSATGVVTPDQRHCGEDQAMLAEHARVYRRAPGMVVRKNPQMAAHRIGLAEPGTARSGARRPWVGRTGSLKTRAGDN